MSLMHHLLEIYFSSLGWWHVYVCFSWKKKMISSVHFSTSWKMYPRSNQTDNCYIILCMCIYLDIFQMVIWMRYLKRKIISCSQTLENHQVGIVKIFENLEIAVSKYLNARSRQKHLFSTFPFSLPPRILENRLNRIHMPVSWPYARWPPTDIN